MMNTETTISTIVYLGAGLCHDLEILLSYSPEKIILVEADPERAESLEHIFVNSDIIKVCCAAVSTFTGKAMLRRYNFADVNSLGKPTGILELFPGLKELETLEVETISSSELMTSLKLQNSAENWLIVDTPGEEMTILRELQEADYLQYFKHLSLNCGRLPLYEGAVAGTEIVDWLQDEGFELLKSEDNEDPDRPCWTLRRSHLLLQYKNLLQQYEKIESKAKQKDATIAENQKHISDLTAKYEELTRQLSSKEQHLHEIMEARTQQASQLNELAEQQKSLETEVEIKLKTIEELAQKNKELSDHIVGKEDQLNKLTELSNDQAARLREKELKIHQAHQKHETALEILKEKDAQIEKASRANAELQNINDKYQKKIDDLSKDIEKLGKQLEAEQKKAQNHSLQLQEEQQYRQQLIDQELIKAEAQLELIKDILIRDKAF